MGQAYSLKKIAGKKDDRRDEGRAGRPMRVIAVTSGKGGVGKTNLVTNLALAVSGLGRKVLVFDADLGLSNVDILLGLTPKHNISHVLSGEKRIDEVIIEGPGGLRILPASSGVQELTELNTEQQIRILTACDGIGDDYDYFFVDTGSGISSNVMYFNAAVAENIVVVTPEPTSITDAYALMKVLSKKYAKKSFRIIVNGTKRPEEGARVFQNLSVVTSRFLTISLEFLGQIPFDGSVTKAVCRQKAFLDSFPECAASRSLVDLGKKLDSSTTSDPIGGNIQFFFRRLVETSAGL